MALDITAVEPVAAPAPAVATKAPGRRARFVFLRNAKALTGIAILVAFTVLAVIGPWIAPYDPSALGPDVMSPPSGAHWLGTTNTGQDVFSQLLVGTRGVMVVGLAAGLIATTLAVLVVMLLQQDRYGLLEQFRTRCRPALSSDRFSEHQQRLRIGQHRIESAPLRFSEERTRVFDFVPGEDVSLLYLTQRQELYNYGSTTVVIEKILECCKIRFSQPISSAARQPDCNWPQGFQFGHDLIDRVLVAATATGFIQRIDP